MDKLQTTMVDTCDRLLLLLTGPQAVRDPVATEAALEAIEFLRVLDGYLQGAADDQPVDEAILGIFLRRPEVSRHVADVFRVLHEEGRCPAWAPRRLNS